MLEDGASQSVVPGRGGNNMWKEHAIETARVLNQIDPDFYPLGWGTLSDRMRIVEKGIPKKIKDLTFKISLVYDWHHFHGGLVNLLSR